MSSCMFGVVDVLRQRGEVLLWLFPLIVNGYRDKLYFIEINRKKLMKALYAQHYGVKTPKEVPFSKDAELAT